MKTLSILGAGFAYFVLGGLWFTPLFGKQWDRAIGFTRPTRWRPGSSYYVAPLLGCLAAAAATSFLAQWTHATTLTQHLLMGLTVGLGYGAAVTVTNAFAPNTPRPATYAVVVGSYHVVGLVLAAAVIHWLS